MHELLEAGKSSNSHFNNFSSSLFTAFTVSNRRCNKNTLRLSIPVCQAIPRMQTLIPPTQYQVPANSQYQHPMAAIDEEPEFKIFPSVTRLANNIFNPGSTIYAEPEEMQGRRTLLMMIPNSSKMVPKTEVAGELENPADLSKMATPEKWSEHLNQMASEGAGASKREQARPKKNSPKTRLNLLIKMGVISDMEEVRYLSKKGNRAVMAKGKATTKGVLCGCCGDVISLSKFEAHAKSTYHRPAENIILADGRSLKECYIEAKKRTVEKDHLGEDEIRSDCTDEVRPDWLPAGWVLELRPRSKETHQIDKFYYEPVYGRQFRSESAARKYIRNGGSINPPKKVRNSLKAYFRKYNGISRFL